jgi:DNA-binding transcriptional LysR family regulator
MSRKIPSFSALRAFEAVASTRSFTAAADELGVTQAAVSRQVRSLEELLGVPLFQRLQGTNELTEPGRRLYAPLRDSLDRIDAAVRSVSAWPTKTLLTVSVAPFFSSVWLTPRIMSFIHANPAIDLRIHHSYAPPDYTRERVDMGINWGNGDWRGVESVKVMDGGLTVVCAPELADANLSKDGPAALRKHALFYEFKLDDWGQWFNQAGIDDTRNFTATRIDDTHALRRIALNGDGFALLCREMVVEDLDCGRLQQPFDTTVDTGSHYYLNYPSDREPSSAAKKFRSWLLGSGLITATI